MKITMMRTTMKRMIMTKRRRKRNGKREEEAEVEVGAAGAQGVGEDDCRIRSLT